MKHTLQLGKYQVVGIERAGDNWIIHFQISTLIGHTVVPFKPKLKPGDWITIYTEVERDVTEDN